MSDLRTYVQVLRREQQRRSLERDVLDRDAHDGRSVYAGYDYDRQEWCKCDYCEERYG